MFIKWKIAFESIEEFANKKQIQKKIVLSVYVTVSVQCA